MHEKRKLIFFLVSYEARAAGVKRGMRGNDALKVCPQLCFVQVRYAVDLFSFK